MKKVKFSRTRSKSVKFNPNSETVESAVQDYLAKGGTITRTVFTEKAFRDFTSTGSHPNEVDEFLNNE